jgi:hypothetical protein
MLHRILGALVIAAGVGGVVLAEDTAGRVTKVEDGSITITTLSKNKGEKGEEKTFKVSKDVKVSKSGGKDKEDVKLTLDELKTAAKVTTVFVTVTHDGEVGSAIKVGFGGVGGRGKGKNKTKKDDK